MSIGIVPTPWIVGWALGDTGATIPASLRRARGSVVSWLGVTLFAPLPLMAAHYALGYGAMGQAPAVTVALLAAVALVASFLGVVITISSAVVADRMADLADAPLQPGGRVR